MPDEASAADRAGKRHSMPLWQESLLLMGLAVVLALVVKTFLVQAFYIPSGSMEPGLEVNDRILVQKVSYWTGEPQRGDVVVFEDPGSWLSPAESAGPTGAVASTLSRIGLYPAGGHLVKRVIGVAGDTITCCDDQGRLLVNGEPLDSSVFTRNDRDCDGPMIASCEWSAGPVPEGSVFVMGDHRDDSADSSFHLRCDVSEERERRRGDRAETDADAEAGGCDATDAYVATDLVVGKVFARVWPASRFSLLDKPDAFDALD
ncbi:signal peptidase I [Nocardioides sp. 31GB23]|uniref:signal peptidase I n=1 Tax=Nocardioides sp. 31GB23 TaxID=3156065 RepID=UPI0032B00D66